MGQRHKHYDVIVAWAAGDEIECLSPNAGKWLSMNVENAPAFYEHYEYRIKPKRVKKEGWVNVYKANGCWQVGMTSDVYATKEQAEAARISAAVACIRIEWEEEI
jgi:hypothetical protein